MKQTRRPTAEVESKPVLEDITHIPAVYAVKNKIQDILPIHSINQAVALAKQTNGQVWEVFADGEGFIFSHPID